ncbi:MAG: hypothetical protein HQK69_01340 [Desulfamplus sp.]|nr:hypothetical protein [Desulfamplus sp.]
MKLAKLIVVLSVLVIIPFTAVFSEESNTIGNALIYNGQFAAPGGAESMSKLAAQFSLNTVWFNEANELLSLLKNAKIVIIGGTEDNINPFIKSFTPDIIKAMNDFINSGGSYLGVCGGGYIASSGWEEESGFVNAIGLVPFESDSYLIDPEPKVIQIEWNKQKNMIYYQFGPKFLLTENNMTNVMAKYDDGSIAAFSMKVGKGKVVLVGPHPEADATWLEESMENFELWQPTKNMAQDMMQEALNTTLDDEICFTQSDIDAAKQEAIQKCKANPASCGIITNEGCATLENNLDITMPCIDVFGTNVSVGLQRFINTTDPAGYYWKLNLE